MKRDIKNRLLLAALPMLLAGCTVHELTEISHSPQDHIGFSSHTALTRVAVATLPVMQNDPNGFSVYAVSGDKSGWYTDDTGKSIDGTNVYKYSAGKWNFNAAVKWPTNPSDYPMAFYAHYPAAPPGLGTVSYGSDAITATFAVQPAGSQTDLLAATVSTAVRPATGILPLVFNHVLSRVNFGIIAGEGVNPYIQAIQVDSVQSVRTYDFKSKSWTGNASVNTFFNYFGHSDGFTVLIPFLPGIRDGSTPNAIYSGHHSNHLMLMPQTSPSWSTQSGNLSGGHITVIYRMTTGNQTNGVGNPREVGFASASDHPNYTAGGYEGPLFVKAGFPLPSVEGTGHFIWEPGRSYIYNIGLGTINSCNGYILDEYYYDEMGVRTNLKLIEVLNEGKTIGSKLQNGVIHVTLVIDAWTDDNQGIHLGSIDVVPASMALYYTAQSPAPHSFSVECRKYDGTEDNRASWTLKIPSAATSWLKLSLRNDIHFNHSEADSVVTSTNGSKTVYIYATENIPSPRKAPLFLNDDLVGEIIQDWDVYKTPNGQVSPDSIDLYVGAFWKATQTGERLIRITRPTGLPSVIDGAWTATVVIGEEWIVIDKEMTTDKTIWTDHPQHSGNDPGFDDLHPVNSTQWNVHGVLRAPGTSGYEDGDEQIYFRIGLTSKFLDYDPDDDPARFGMVMLSYKDNTLMQHIWIRQGEGNVSIANPNTKFNPYNLGKTDDRSYYGNNGFVSYPTQAGYFYQWATPSTSLAPYHPVDPPEGPPSNWVIGGDYFSLTNACPDGYIVPSRADFNATTLTTSNAHWGYYADGFFDRRQIKNALGIGTPWPHSAVSTSSDSVAYIGNLFHNPITHATNFSPAAGYRGIGSPNIGHLRNAGHDGMYVLTDRYDNTGNNWFLNFWPTNSTSTGLLISQYDRHTAYSVRCIRHP